MEDKEKIIVLSRQAVSFVKYFFQEDVEVIIVRFLGIYYSPGARSVRTISATVPI
ncbi:hypothetical protein HOD08_00585 [bacterium]|nr:hypothetical protein [bacterium]